MEKKQFDNFLIIEINNYCREGNLFMLSQFMYKCNYKLFEFPDTLIINSYLNREYKSGTKFLLILEFLLSYHANIYEKDIKGNNILHYAILKLDYDLINFLIKKYFINRLNISNKLQVFPFENIFLSYKKKELISVLSDLKHEHLLSFNKENVKKQELLKKSIDTISDLFDNKLKKVKEYFNVNGLPAFLYYSNIELKFINILNKSNQKLLESSISTTEVEAIKLEFNRMITDFVKDIFSNKEIKITPQSKESIIEDLNSKIKSFTNIHFDLTSIIMSIKTKKLELIDIIPQLLNFINVLPPHPHLNKNSLINNNN